MQGADVSNDRSKQLDGSARNGSNSDIPLHLSGQFIQYKQQSEADLDSIETTILNIRLFCSLLITREPVPLQVLQSYKPMILKQLRQMQENLTKMSWRQQKVEILNDLVTKFGAKSQVLDYNCFSNLDELNRSLHQLYEQVDRIKLGGTTSANFQKQNSLTSEIHNTRLKHAISAIKALWRQLFQIIEEDTFTLQRLENYDLYQNNIQKQQGNILQKVPETHFSNELIDCKIQYAPQVFSWVQPPFHALYISEAARAYHEIVPIKIKHISPFNPHSPKILVENYFKLETQPQKAIICLAKPKTKTLVFYRIDDICKLSTIEKQYAHQVQLPIKWVFSSDSKLITTPEGRIFGINCRNSKQRTDRSMYQIAEQKVSNRGQLPQPKRQSSVIYLNGCIYVIGGKGPNQPCSKKGFRYIIKQKKWQQISQSNYSLRKPTLCPFQNKYILKFGGINEFDYINKGIQMYDPSADAWGIVRVSSKNALQQVQILEDSMAVQINDDQVYVFGGKNGNRFSSDSGFVLSIDEIRQRKNRAPKVSGQFFNATVGTRNCYSFFGCHSQSNVITFGNCLYVLRKSITSIAKNQ